MNTGLTSNEEEMLCIVKENSGYERGPYPAIPLPVLFLDYQDEVGGMRAIRALVWVGFVKYATCPKTGLDAVELTDKGFDAYEALAFCEGDERVNQY